MTRRQTLKTIVAALAVSASALALAPAPVIAQAPKTAVSQDARVRYNTVRIDDVDVFYREAGPKDAPAILLLHGFPTSSHMFRNLIPALADKYRVIAPDLPGFGHTKAPAGYKYDFAALTETIEGFTATVGLKRFAIYVFDYGAPVGYRLALKKPDRITAIISQNGNAYEEGLNPAGWAPIQTYWTNPTKENRDALRPFFKAETTKWQYTHGTPDAALVSPDGYTMDQVTLDSPGNAEIQLDLFGDYATNVALYPKFHEYFRAKKPPLLAVWGKNDPFFTPQGAEAYRRDNPNAEVRLLDTGHFALETHGAEIAALIRDFLGRTVK
ncbi:MAG: alpha/beta hydrolase [Hyphomicrobiales bacterium]|nr:alpha/beta hydrolase [Hyphomicrobiales bacterium]